MSKNEILFQALGPIGAMSQYYTYTDTSTSFVQLIWTDNTLKQQPSESIKNLILHLYESISICSSCVYGIPKGAQYPRYICPATSSAAAYNFYISAIISNLSSLPSFLNVVRSNIEGIINGTTSEAAFYDTCFSLLKITNFTHFLAEAADPLTKNFSDTITIQPLLPQIDQISAAVKEIVSKSDQLKYSIVNKIATPQNVLSYNDTINSFINIIPQYSQAYSNLLIQLQNEFIGIYCNEKSDNESENKSLNKKKIEIDFDVFIQKMKNYINPIQKVVLSATELLSQKPFPGVCDNLLIKLKEVIDNINEMIMNYSKLMHFRGDQFESYKKKFLECHAKNTPLLQEIKSQFVTILNSDFPPAFQSHISEELKTSLDILITGNIAAEIKADFEQNLKLILNDPRSVVFKPILSSSVPTNQITSLVLKSIETLIFIAQNLRSSKLQFQEIKDKLSELHPTIKNLLTAIYNKIHKNMLIDTKSKTKTGKKKKVKTANFSFTPEIIVLNQKKSYIQNLFVSFDESLRKLSPESKILRIIQDNCALKAILLALAIATLETCPNLQKEVVKLHSILINFADNYFNENEKTINDIITFFKDEKNIPNGQKPQFDTVIKNLSETTKFAKIVFTEEKQISQVTETKMRIELIKKKVAEYEKLSLIFSSLQYIGESYLPENVYHETILNLQQNMINIVKNYQNTTQIYAYQNFMCLSKLFAMLLILIKNVLPHSSKESNYSNIMSVDLNRVRAMMASMNGCGIGFDPESYKLLKAEIEQNLKFFKDQKDFYYKKIEQNFFQSTLQKSFKTMDEFYQTVEKSIAYLEICEVNYDIPQKDCIGPILKHYTLHINYTFDKYALALINNLPTVVQLAMNLNDLLRELDKALRYIPKVKTNDIESIYSVSELEKIQSKFECPGKILFQRTSEIPLLSDYFEDDKQSLNIALQSKKEIITEAIQNVMSYLSKIVTFTRSEICKFEDIELNRQKTEYELLVEQSQKEYQQYREEQLKQGQKIDEYRKEVQEKERIEREKEEKEKFEREKIEKEQKEEAERNEKHKKLLYKEPNSNEINPIFGMGIYLKCGFSPENISIDPNDEIDLSIDIEKLSDFSSLPSIKSSVFENAIESPNDKKESENNTKIKYSDLISDLQRQLMPPDYLLTAIECGLLKEKQDNNNDDMQNDEENDDVDPLDLIKKNEDDDEDDEDEDENEEDENSGGGGDDFDLENDPILGNRNLAEDDDEFFESCSSDDDEEEEEHKNFFPWG